MASKPADIGALKELARNFRRDILETIAGAGSGHPAAQVIPEDLFQSLKYLSPFTITG
jgi:hypothetical protein